MKWWDGLWLNEGFAEYMQFIICGDIFPEWELDSLFFVGEHQVAFTSDSSSFTHPIYSSLENEADAVYLFDEITYDKGKSMLQRCINYSNDGPSS
jgi:aminopeptidase N